MSAISAHEQGTNSDVVKGKQEGKKKTQKDGWLWKTGRKREIKKKRGGNLSVCAACNRLTDEGVKKRERRQKEVERANLSL